MQKWQKKEITDKMFLMMDTMAKCMTKQKAVEFLQEGMMYAVLVYAVLNGTIGIAGFTLFIGSVQNFNQSVGSALGLITQMRKDRRYLCDFRKFLEYPEYPEKEGAKDSKSTFRKDLKKYGAKESSETSEPDTGSR